MQHGVLSSIRDLDLRSNFENDLSRSTYKWFDSSQPDKYDDALIIAVYFDMNKIIRGRRFRFKNSIFYFDLWSVER